MLSANGLQPMVTVEWKKYGGGGGGNVVWERFARLHVGNIPHA